MRARVPKQQRRLRTELSALGQRLSDEFIAPRRMEREQDAEESRQLTMALCRARAYAIELRAFVAANARPEASATLAFLDELEQQIARALDEAPAVGTWPATTSSASSSW